MFLTRDNTKGKKLREGRRGRREDEKSTREGHDEEEETREDKREREELGSGLGEGVGDHAGGGVARCCLGVPLVILRTLDPVRGGEEGKELYYVPGVSSRGGGLWWNRRCEPAVRGCASAAIANCSVSLSLSFSLARVFEPVNGRLPL